MADTLHHLSRPPLELVAASGSLITIERMAWLVEHATIQKRKSGPVTVWSKGEFVGVDGIESIHSIQPSWCSNAAKSPTSKKKSELTAGRIIYSRHHRAERNERYAARVNDSAQISPISVIIHHRLNLLLNNIVEISKNIKKMFKDYK